MEAKIEKVLMMVILALLTFVLPGCKVEDYNTPDSYVDLLYGEYDGGGLEISLESKCEQDSEVKLLAEGRHGSNNRMTQVYEKNGKELAISFEYLNNSYNLLIQQADIETGSWQIQSEKGIEWMMAVLPAQADNTYFAVYAISDDMSIEELAETISGSVVIKCDWDVSYVPEYNDNDS
jgi:hypothetical protein